MLPQSLQCTCHIVYLMINCLSECADSVPHHLTNVSSYADKFLFLRSHKLKHTDSFVECEDLNRLGRFSFNRFNKETEVCTVLMCCYGNTSPS